MNKSKVMLLFATALVVVFAAWTYAGTPGQPRVTVYEVRIDGEQIGIVLDKNLAERVLEEQKGKSSTELVASADLRLKERVTFVSREVRESEVDNLNLLSAEELEKVLAGRLTFVTSATYITVDGRAVVAVTSEEAARQVLDEITSEYEARLLERGRVQVEEVRITERVGFETGTAAPEEVRAVAEAKRILLRGTDKVIIHTVKEGDSLWAIASERDMTVEEIRKANPQLKSDLIRPGDQLDLVVPDPYINIQSTEVYTYTRSIPYRTKVIKDESLWPWQRVVRQAGKYGSKEITVRILRENGREISRTTIEERVTAEPVTRVVVQGTREIPQRGTGTFIWPMLGRITSEFGWRWGRLHEGIDIAAPSGTSVKAADSGTVTFAGWDGGYGYVVRIDHGGGIVTVYGHLSSFLVSPGDVVKKGEVIARSGNTGRSTGPHLHFEVRVNGKPQDPIRYYPAD